MKRVLITGANKGIGLATVEAILQDHDDVSVIVGSRDLARGNAAITGLVERNPDWASRLELLELDVSSDESVLAARAQFIERHGSNPAPLQGLVNNAGIGLGSADLHTVVNVNTLGVKRVCDAFLPLVAPQGRVVNVSSASGPKFVSQCSAQRQQFFKNGALGWNDIKALITLAGKPQEAGLGDMNAYGFSKACVSLYTLILAREHPELVINACTPGYIETDLTRPQAQRQGVTPIDMGMKPPQQGTRATLFLLFGEPRGSGDYYGSDAKRSPLDRYRAPGDPEFNG